MFFTKAGRTMLMNLPRVYRLFAETDCSCINHEVAYFVLVPNFLKAPCENECTMTVVEFESNFRIFPIVPVDSPLEGEQLFAVSSIGSEDNIIIVVLQFLVLMFMVNY